jgi:hypothetical protein
MKGLRLNDYQIKAIRSAFQESFLPEDHLWLFGSRADLTKRGGDIDLYVETKLQPLKNALDARNKFFIQLIHKLGDQKIDIVINNNSGDKLIYNIAETDGVQLV